MSFTQTFRGLLPPPREDAIAWTLLRVAFNATTAAGPFAEIAVLAITPDPNPAYPGPVGVTVTTVPAATGWFVFSFDVSPTNPSPPSEAVYGPVDTSQIVTLAELKDYLNIPVDDDVHDIKLARAIRTARPLVEAVTGPIVPTRITEWHDGGSSRVQIRRRPSTAPGTTPLLELVECAEWSGSTRHDLTVVANPSLGTSYSATIDPIGTITRRTSGGGIGVFDGGPLSVLVTYIAGQSIVPANVIDGTLELIRVNYMTTQPVGRGRMTVADDQDGMVNPGWYMPRRVRELLSPNRRAPSVA